MIFQLSLILPNALSLIFAKGERGDLYISLGLFVFLILLGLIVGGMIERRHLADIRVRSEALRSMLVTDLKSFPLADAAQTSSALFVGEVAITGDYLKNFLAVLRNIFGGNIRSFESLLTRARDEARLRVMEQAARQGYNAICNLRYETADVAGRSEGGKNKLIAVAVIASATAYHAKA